jgi:hypothetical protein
MSRGIDALGVARVLATVKKLHVVGAWFPASPKTDNHSPLVERCGAEEVPMAKPPADVENGPGDSVLRRLLEFAF